MCASILLAPYSCLPEAETNLYNSLFENENMKSGVSFPLKVKSVLIKRILGIKIFEPKITLLTYILCPIRCIDALKKKKKRNRMALHIHDAGN